MPTTFSQLFCDAGIAFCFGAIFGLLLYPRLPENAMSVKPSDIAVVDPLAALLETLARSGTLTTPRRKPGPARGTPATGHRPKEPHNPGQLDFWHTWQVWPASTRPSIKAMAAALGCHPQTFARKMRADNQGRGLSVTELGAAADLLATL